MSESIGTSYLVMMVAVIISIFSVLIITFFSFSRAHKTKNKMVDIIEKHEGYDSGTKKEIDQYLKDVGYTVKRKSVSCPRFKGQSSLNNNSTYAYCVYEFPTNRGKYYTVYIFVNINLPIINDFVELKIKGQSRTIYDL